LEEQLIDRWPPNAASTASALRGVLDPADEATRQLMAELPGCGGGCSST
jgi:hypothetical protein